MLREATSAETKTRPQGRAFSGGEGGIRTLGGHEAHNGFRDRPIQPLWHLPSLIYELRLWIDDWFLKSKIEVRKSPMAWRRDYNSNFFMATIL